MARRGRPWTPEDEAEARRLKSAGQGYAEVGKTLGRSRSAVFNRLNAVPKPEAQSRAYGSRRYENDSWKSVAPIACAETLDNGGYTKGQLNTQNDAFAEAMRRALGKGTP